MGFLAENMHLVSFNPKRLYSVPLLSLGILLLFWLGVLGLCIEAVSGDDLNSHLPGCVATSAERLQIEQVEELTKAQQFDEVIQTLEQLSEMSQGRVIEVDGLQAAGTLAVQRYIPIRQWASQRLHRLLEDNPALRAGYDADHRDVAANAIADAARSQDLSRLKQVVERYCQTSDGDRYGLILADAYIERGWGLAATQWLQRSLPDLRRSIADASGQENGSLPIALLHRRRNLENRSELARLWHENARRKLWQAEDIDNFIADVGIRLVDSVAICPEAGESESVKSWLTTVAANLNEEPQKRLTSRIQQVSLWKRDSEDSSNAWLDFGGGTHRSGQGHGRAVVGDWPTWNQVLERFSGSSDQNIASRPRVGELDDGLLSYHPIVHRNRIYVNELTRIVAYDLEKGTSWPPIEPPLPLFDSHITPAALLPLGYPMVGVARGTLALKDDCLYARMGTPVTGWSNGESSPDGGSMGYLVGLDLKRQGSLLKGFPLRLTQADFAGAEPEGCPLVIGDRIYVAVVKRDNVGIRRSVAAFDRFNGTLLWKSPVLASGMVEGSDRANLLSHQLLSAAGGRLFYNTNLGTIACLDLLNGQVEWLTRYRRPNRQKQAFPGADRFRFRDLNPCMIQCGVVYCAPQDCPEVFALDATTGDLIWATDDTTAADAIHILGVEGEHVVLSGDRLIWLDRLTGKYQQSFPAATTLRAVHALPSPRGLGRGAISGGEIYWPVVNEVLVFDAKVDTSTRVPRIHRRMRMDLRGSEGGNIVIVDGWMLMATPSRLLAYRSR